MTIYTDGSCNNRRGHELSKIGGIGIVVVENDEIVAEHSGGAWHDTDSYVMELLAIVTALEMVELGEEKIVIYTDNQSCSDTLAKGWLDDWVEDGRIHDKNPLWLKFINQFIRHSGNVELRWVKGHVSKSDPKRNRHHDFNDRADELAKAGRLKRKRTKNWITTNQNQH